MITKYERPILRSLFNFLGALVILAAMAGAVFLVLADAWRDAITLAAGGLFAGLLYLGIAQVVDYLARMAHAAEQQCDLLESAMTRLAAIEGRLSPETPLMVRIDPTPPPMPGVRAGFYYSLDGSKLGPISLPDLKRLWADSVINDGTPVMRVEDAQWSTYGELLGTKRAPG